MFVTWNEENWNTNISHKIREHVPCPLPKLGNVIWSLQTSPLLFRKTPVIQIVIMKVLIW